MNQRVAVSVALAGLFVLGAATPVAGSLAALPSVHSAVTGQAHGAPATIGNVVVPVQSPKAAVTHVGGTSTSFGVSGTPSWDAYPVPDDQSAYQGFLSNPGSPEPSGGFCWAKIGNTANPANPGTKDIFYYKTLTGEGRATWDDTKTPPTVSWTPASRMIESHAAFLDPILHTDEKTCRTWAGQMELPSPCTTDIGYRDEDPAKPPAANPVDGWTPIPAICNASSQDHETIGSGPFSKDVPLPLNAAYPSIVYYCTQYLGPGVGLPIVGAPGLKDNSCAESYDGGLNWVAIQPGEQLPPTCWDIFGHLKVSPEGYAAIPHRDCSDGVHAGMELSKNNGLTWTAINVPSIPNTGYFDPSLEFSRSAKPDGNSVLYYGQAMEDGLYAAVSADFGTSWTHGGKITGSGAPVGSVAASIQQAEFANVVAGDWNRAAISFLGQTGVPHPEPTDACDSWAGVWNMYIARTFDAGATWTVEKVSADPVQIGDIWASGGTFDCRNLLDFNDLDIGSDGRVAISFADGCTGACATATDPTPGMSRDAKGTVIRQSSGCSLFAAVTPTCSEDAATHTANPTVTITSPTTGATVTASPFTVSGQVNRDDAGTSGNSPPTAAFACSPLSGLSLGCTDASTDSDGTVTAWAWDFGDGTSTTTQSPGHTYAAAGTYTITLTVTDDGGATSAPASHSYTVASGGGNSGCENDPAGDTKMPDPQGLYDLTKICASKTTSALTVVITTPGRAIDDNLAKAVSPVYYTVITSTGHKMGIYGSEGATADPWLVHDDDTATSCDNCAVTSDGTALTATFPTDVVGDVTTVQVQTSAAEGVFGLPLYSFGAPTIMDLAPDGSGTIPVSAAGHSSGHNPGLLPSGQPFGAFQGVVDGFLAVGRTADTVVSGVLGWFGLGSGPGSGAASQPSAVPVPGSAIGTFGVVAGSETATTFQVQLTVSDLSKSPPGAIEPCAPSPQPDLLGDICLETGLSTQYTVDFYYHYDAAHTATSTHYQAYAEDFTAYMPTPGPPASDGHKFALNVVHDSTGTGDQNWVSTVQDVAGTWDSTAGVITWTIPKAPMVVKVAPTSTTGATLGGASPVKGLYLDTFSAEVGTWIYAGGAGSEPSATVWNHGTNSDTYSFTGGAAANAAPTAAFSCAPTGLSLACTDASTDDGTIAAWDWDWGDGSAHATTANPSHTYAAGGAKTVSLRVTDDGTLTGTTSHGYTLSAGGSNPCASASGERVEVYESATCLGYQATATGGSNPATASWSVSVGGLSNSQHTLVAKWFDGATLVASSASITVTVNAAGTGGANHAPSANAGNDKFAQVGSLVKLAGYGSDDADASDTLTYAWTQDAADTTQVTLTDANTVLASFTAPATAQVLHFTLTVSDGQATSTDGILVTIQDCGSAPEGRGQSCTGVANADPTLGALTATPATLTKSDTAQSSSITGTASDANGFGDIIAIRATLTAPGGTTGAKVPSSAITRDTASGKDQPFTVAAAVPANAATGTYTVDVTVYDNDGSSAHSAQTFQVNAASGLGITGYTDGKSGLVFGSSGLVPGSATPQETANAVSIKNLGQEAAPMQFDMTDFTCSGGTAITVLGNAHVKVDLNGDGVYSPDETFAYAGDTVLNVGTVASGATVTMKLVIDTTPGLSSGSVCSASFGVTTPHS